MTRSVITQPGPRTTTAFFSGKRLVPGDTFGKTTHDPFLGVRRVILPAPVIPGMKLHLMSPGSDRLYDVRDESGIAATEGAYVKCRPPRKAQGRGVSASSSGRAGSSKSAGSRVPRHPDLCSGRRSHGVLHPSGGKKFGNPRLHPRWVSTSIFSPRTACGLLLRPTSATAANVGIYPRKVAHFLRG